MIVCICVHLVEYEKFIFRSLNEDYVRKHQPVIAFSENSFLHEELGEYIIDISEVIRTHYSLKFGGN